MTNEPIVQTIDQNLFFVTMDAETDCIPESVKYCSEIRDEVEQREGIKVPIIWFVRFQRSWTDSIEFNEPFQFQKPIIDGFDGFEMLNTQVQGLIDRGDEIGWHYHAYHYVHRDDLSHEIKVKNTQADLEVCASTIHCLYPDLKIRSFRWGWFFNPDHLLSRVLNECGITCDASVFPGMEGGKVSRFNAKYLEPVTHEISSIDGMNYFPFRRTLLIHDYQLVAHNLGWSELSKFEAEAKRSDFKNDLTQFISKAREQGAACSTYQKQTREE